MRQLLGGLILLLGLALATVLVLRIWGIHWLSSVVLLRSGATLAVLVGALVGLVVVRFAFFQNSAAGYDARAGNRAHPRTPAAPTPPEQL